MGQFFDSIPAWLIPWIEAQKIFWVATAPLAEDGHVNVSPKGCFEKTLNVIPDEESSQEEGKRTSRAVWYEDLTGSGVETISHLRENGRITLMLNAFEGPPRIVRLFGVGKAYEFGTPEYNALLPPGKKQPGSRAIIWIDIHKVGTSCGYSIPFFEYKAPRVRLHQFWVPREKVDMEHEESCSLPPPSYQTTTGNSTPSESIVLVNPPEEPTVLPPAKPLAEKQLPEKGVKYYWKNRNMKSLDGLPGLTYAYDSDERMGQYHGSGDAFAGLIDDETDKLKKRPSDAKPLETVADTASRDETTGRVILGFGAGVLVGVALSRWRL